MPGKRIVVPFGPQHPVLPEPIHIDLVLEDEKVVEALPSIGYIHRGLEKLVERRDYNNYMFVAERICGICSFIHGMSYCQAVEGMFKTEIPERAQYLRTIWSEYSRMHSHLLWLGLFADSFGFESLFMNIWRMREGILDAMEATTGGRVIQGASKVGGVRKDISEDMLSKMAEDLDRTEGETRDLLNVFLKDESVKHRLCGVGNVSKRDTYELGAVGPTARGSGVAYDARQLGYCVYEDLKFKPVVEESCDCYGRCKVRADEVLQSMDLVRAAIEKIPKGPIETKITGNPTGEYTSRVEQPRGEAIHYVKGNGTKNLERFRVRTPTFANIPALLKMLEGCEYADVPVIVLSIDPCISCTER